MSIDYNRVPDNTLRGLIRDTTILSFGPVVNLSSEFLILFQLENLSGA